MLWTRYAVKHLIIKEFGIELSIWTVVRYLKKWGFTPQRPIYKAIQKDPKRVTKFLQEEYPAIKKRTKSDNAEVHWCDESRFRTDHTYERSYGLKGNTPIVNKTGKRLNCNMISSVANNGSMKFMIYQDNMTVDLIIKFFSKLIYKQDKKIFVILDNLKVHHAKKLRTWIEKRKDKIELFFLPSHSPDLNPDELLNQDVKSNAYKHKIINTKKELIRSIRSYLHKVQKTPQKLIDYFKKDCVRFAG